MVDYDDLDAAAQSKVGGAIKTFLEDGGFRNLGHAMQELGMEPQELWSMNMREADLPDCMMPEMIQIGHAN